MRNIYIILLGFVLLGCREKPAPTPKDTPVETPVAAGATNRPDTLGGAIGDVITQRPVIEAGRRAKVQIEAASAKENKAIEDVLHD